MQFQRVKSPFSCLVLERSELALGHAGPEVLNLVRHECIKQRRSGDWPFHLKGVGVDQIRGYPLRDSGLLESNMLRDVLNRGREVVIQEIEGVVKRKLGLDFIA